LAIDPFGSWVGSYRVGMRRSLIVAAAAASLLVLVSFAAATPERQTVRVRPFVSGLSAPVFVTAPSAERNVLYVVEQGGKIRVVRGGKLQSAPFLDVSRLIVSGSEQGLLGLAFHPNYASNRKLYVNYTNRGGDTRVVEYRSNGRKALPGSARVLLSVDQPYGNHNGGMVAFGPDGRLYVGMGDGGSGGDPHGNGQSSGTLLGKLLRIDVDKPGSKPEIAALGLRNPWRFSFDRKSGDLYIGDVGQGALEEIDFVKAGTQQLLNFGWNVYEGRSVFQQGTLGAGKLVQPIAQYSHSQGCSVTGGYVFRGKGLPRAVGTYFYGDYCSGTIWSLKVVGGVAQSVRTTGFTVPNLTSFGEDADGSLYLVSAGGTIYRLVS
jgi:glucose/arabinose dehydrogenase